MIKRLLLQSAGLKSTTLFNQQQHGYHKDIIIEVTPDVRNQS